MISMITYVLLALCAGAFSVGKPTPVMIDCMSQVHSPTFRDRLRFREKADDQTTIWLFSGEELNIQFELPSPAVVDIVDIRYSNDGDYDLISVSLDGKELGQFKTNAHYAWGDLWNAFESSGPVGGAQFLAAGQHEISLKVLDSDEYGLEVDYIRISAHGSRVENLRNEHFLCSHTPGKAESKARKAN
ncbi:hypothetical protein DPMN_026152 [Dreissena polymorpha]|uniref:Uncharacterized protein n=2 Tax=Dreissena polymorpha TaxID=45954 RepID=A0A9D4RD76_DREPO|nr:hypothetical protein DPMN_026152 [Dreissena polymorpha]